MDDLGRSEVIQALERGWGEYAGRFQKLDPEDRAKFLQRQGYARLGDLLAHVAAWWALGREKLEQKLAGVTGPPSAIDVDEFNAAAVRQAAGLSEEQILEGFHRQRLALLRLVEAMPEEVLTQAGVQRRLRGLVTDHLEEHSL